ncbi:hypothetical protein EUTSA_v100131791mg, partial [Eutrema salsugineum]
MANSDIRFRVRSRGQIFDIQILYVFFVLFLCRLKYYKCKQIAYGFSSFRKREKRRKKKNRGERLAMKKNALWLLCVLVLPAIACGRKPEKKVTSSSGRKEDDLVTGLPGQPPVNFRHYAGYVDLGLQQKQKALFYWFFEAQQNSSGRPLVLWLNG